MNNPTVVITHHAVSLKTHTVDDVDMWHKERWPGFVSRAGYHVGYHYVIDWDGTVTQTREHDEEGAHCIGMNKSSIGVCFMGNFDRHRPSESQLTAWHNLYTTLGRQFPGIKTYPHRKYATKSCHGKMLSDDYFARESQVMTLKEELQRLIAKLRSILNRYGK